MSSATKKQREPSSARRKAVAKAKALSVRRTAAPVKRNGKRAGGGEPERASPALAEVDAEALEFIAAIDRFKKENGRPFPSWSEVLLVLRQLGYQRR
jgi:hypothetical protein